MPRKIIYAFAAFLLITSFSTGNTLADEEAKNIIKSAIEHYRDVTSYLYAKMTIHRPSWERSMEMRIWTKGLDKSIARITAPKKDAGNGMLTIDDQMWNYSPKINRVIKIPNSMAHQSWMGSDYSNNDVSRADDIINEFEHTLLDTSEHDGHRLYKIQSIPHEDAPVVWGKEIMLIRDDYVILTHEFYDQDGIMVKKMTTSDIRFVSGKNVAMVERMQRMDKEEHWTEFKVGEIKFGLDIPDKTFTLSNLRNPRFEK